MKLPIKYTISHREYDRCYEVVAEVDMKHVSVVLDRSLSVLPNGASTDAFDQAKEHSSLMLHSALYREANVILQKLHHEVRKATHFNSGDYLALEKLFKELYAAIPLRSE